MQYGWFESVNRIAAWGLSGLLGSGLAMASPAADDLEARYQAGLAQYKAGECQPAAQAMHDLMVQYPEIERLKSDYIAIAVGCKNYRAVLQYSTEAYLKTAPPYVKEALLEAAIHEQDLSAGLRVQRYSTVDSLPLMHLMADRAYQALADKQLTQALDVSAELIVRYPNQEKAWETRAYVLRETGLLFDALRAYQTLQTRFPNNMAAPKAIANLLLALGMPQLAAEKVSQNHIALTPQEQFKLQVDIATRQLRWSETYDHDLRRRHYYANQAVKNLNAAREFALANNLGVATVRYLDYDRVVAYQVAYDYPQSVALYEALIAQGEAVPSYVQLAVAASYSSTRQYAKAEAMYRAYLAQDPDNLDATFGLYYALIDQDKFDDGQRMLDQLTGASKDKLIAANRRQYLPGDYREFVETLRENYTSEVIAQAMVVAYRDRLEEANQGIDAVLDLAPASQEALVAKGNIENWMGNPRAAGEYFQIVRQVSPENVEARLGAADALFEQRHYREARQQIEALAQDYPEKRGVQDLVRKLAVYDSPMMTADFEVGNGKASTQNLSSATADVRVYSNPLDDNYRVYARFRGLYSGPAVQSNISAGALGLKYDGPSHSVAAEAGDRGYAKLEGTKYLSDALSASLSFERNAFYLFPGALYATSSGNVFGGRLDWKNNDSQRAALGYQYWSLTNNNQTQAFGSFSQRLLTDYNYRLEGAIWIGNQQNTNPNVGYFAPLNQTEYSGTLSFEYMQWRDIETKRYAFWHKFWGTYGVVTQQGFTTLPMNTLGYGQNFNLGDKQRLVWGLGKTYFPFDGVRSGYLTGYLRFEKSF